MRLTLRTLLAYMDDVLAPADARELGKKIEESDFASELVQKVRRSVRKQTLGAPHIEGKGKSLDTNTVAEYLDSTLPPDRTPDFEKVCLESETHLAEVSACHQILTLVLGEPAQIPPSTRERIYRMGSPMVSGLTDENQRIPSPAEVAKAATAPAEQAVTPATSTATAPASGPSMWPITITALLVFVLVGAILMVFFNPFNSPNGNGDGGTLAHNEKGTPEEPKTPGPQQPFGPEGDPSNAIVLPPDTTPNEDPDPVVLPVPDGDSETDPFVDPEPDPETDPEPVVDDPSTDPVTDVTVPTIPVPAAPAPGADVDVAPTGAPVGTASADTKQPLMKYLSSLQQWRPVASRTQIVSGNRLLALPTLRPVLWLDAGAKATLVGTADVTVAEPDAQGYPVLALSHGRMLLQTAEKSGVHVALRLEKQRGVLTLLSPNTEVGVEVIRNHVAGRDPETEVESLATVRFYTLSGSATWQEEGAESVALDASSVFAIQPQVQDKPMPLQVTPPWIDGSNTREIDRQAAEGLTSSLAAGRALSLTLAELAEDRRIEVRSLAIRSLASLNRFDHAIESLADPDMKAYWATHVDALHAGLVRSPTSAKQVLSDLEKTRQQNAPALFKMLQGSKAEDIRPGGARAEELVNYLSHNELDYRVLAFENLRRATGKTFSYRPDKEPSRQGREIRRWVDFMKGG